MKVEIRDGRRERKILLWFIADSEVLGKFSSQWKQDGLFGSRWANVVGKWCINHYKKYSQAPGRAIETLFEAWSEKTQEKETVELVNKFLVSLSDEWDEEPSHNTQHMIDVAKSHFDEVKLKRHEDKIRQLRESGNVEEALNEISSFERINLGSEAMINGINDDDAFRSCLEKALDPVFTLPGDMGKFVNGSLLPGKFIALFGKEKSGKSFWLVEFLWRAMEQRKRVAFFECGDMTKDDVMKRLAVRVARRPLYAKTIKYPTGIKKVEGKVSVETKEKTWKDHLTFSEIEKARDEFKKTKLRSKRDFLKITCTAADQTSVADIERSLRELEQKEEFIADVVIIDYADLLAPLDTKKDERGRINDTWKALRGLSQKLNVLVITATQVKASAYVVDLLGMEHFADDKRKMTYVTGILGINQNATEKEMDKCRLNWIVNRDHDWHPKKVVHVAGCRDICNLCLHSTF